MIDWHFPRPALAAHILGDLYDRGVGRQAFFGRRRIGKTEFLNRDLLPAALDKGVHAVYCSMWEIAPQPHLALIHALQRGTTEKPGVLKRVALSGGLGGLSLSLQPGADPRPQTITAADLIHVSDAFNDWLEHLNGQSALLILDEIQHLATDIAFAAFAAQLRTLLDQNAAQLRVIFTGSSQSDLRRLFQDPRAAFYNFTQVSDFPVLGDDFVQHLCAIYQRITRQQLHAAHVRLILDETAGNALITAGLVQQLTLTLSSDVLGTWQAYKAEMTAPDGYLWTLWTGLAASDKLVYRLSRAGKPLFGEEALEAYRQAGFSRGTAQQAVARLEAKGLLIKSGRGQYEAGLPLLDDWLQGGEAPE